MKRFYIDNENNRGIEYHENCNGDWVRWQDVKKAFKEQELNYVDLSGVRQRFPTNPEIFKWLSEQGYQTDSGEQEYTMMYELDMPKIFGDFIKFIAKY